ncbi:hypothetical protein QBC37DRAFT_85661 [Rhypophila decipiens]|uniref:Zn(2)-C6 fungal-type domain-containing protein n=1 Tax=Rhypophila decipiens TaxID=261697 RepID=A0AAN7B082_9PEZI|nr:hypothetical protein QBC37DRAFT_85661 [Rhypophila decipiens]
MSPLAVPESPSGLMPRRQSCDRCHEQKVRCFTNETHGSKGEDDCTGGSLPQSGRFISPNPCSRCKRAKATCIYSPQQRSGRPRLPRDATSLPIRKRRVSRRSSSSVSRSPTSSPSSSPSHPPSGPSSSPGIAIWTPHQVYRQQALESHVPSQFTAMSVVQNTDCYPDSRTFFGQPQLTISGWSSVTDNSSYGIPEPQVSYSTTPAEIPYTSPFILKSNASPAEIPNARRYHDTSDQHQTWSFESQRTSSYLEQLTEINTRLYRVHQNTSSLSSCPTSSTLAFSPTINEVCNTAHNLADLTERYNSERTSAVDAASTFVFNTTSSSASTAIDSAMDASICVMIFSCHQTMLGAFEDICHSFLMWLSEMHSQPQPLSLMGDVFTGPSETVAQILSMANLLSHPLQRLEQSVRPLDLDIDPSLSLIQTPQTFDNDEQINAAGLSPTASPNKGGAYGYYDGTGDGQYDYAQSTGGHDTGNTTATSIYNQMEQRKYRVKAQIRAIRRWIRKSGDRM